MMPSGGGIASWHGAGRFVKDCMRHGEGVDVVRGGHRVQDGLGFGVEGHKGSERHQGPREEIPGMSVLAWLTHFVD